MFAFRPIDYDHYLAQNASTVFTDSDPSRHAPLILIILPVFLGCLARWATEVLFFSDPMVCTLALFNPPVVTLLLPEEPQVLNDFREPFGKSNDRPIYEPEKFSELDIDSIAWRNGGSRDPCLFPIRIIAWRV